MNASCGVVTEPPGEQVPPAGRDLKAARPRGMVKAAEWRGPARQAGPTQARTIKSASRSALPRPWARNSDGSISSTSFTTGPSAVGSRSTRPYSSPAAPPGTTASPARREQFRRASRRTARGPRRKRPALPPAGWRRASHPCEPRASTARRGTRGRPPRRGRCGRGTAGRAARPDWCNRRTWVIAASASPERVPRGVLDPAPTAGLTTNAPAGGDERLGRGDERRRDDRHAGGGEGGGSACRRSTARPGPG